MSDNIWKTINSVGPRLQWKKYHHNYWGTWYYGNHLEFWPTKQKFKYDGNVYIGAEGYKSLMEAGGIVEPSLEERMSALEEAVALLLQESA